jgi:hypothetical protein
MGTYDMVETPAVCCDHLAAIVHEQALSQGALIINGKVIVWNWRAGNQVVVLVSFPELDVLPQGPYSPVTSFIATTICTSWPRYRLPR